MDIKEKYEILKALTWDYTIPVKDIVDVLEKKNEFAGHYTRSELFKKLLESYPWYTIINILPIDDIKNLLTRELIQKLRSPSLRKQYTFVQKRLQGTLPYSG